MLFSKYLKYKINFWLYFQLKGNIHVLDVKLSLSLSLCLGKINVLEKKRIVLKNGW